MNNTSSADSALLSGLQGIKCNPRETYQIIDKLGEGTYGTVFKAINKITDQLVAIKICQINEDEEVFYNEFEFLRSIDHPYIVKLFDAYQTVDELWLVIEYCQLGSVADILQITKTPFTEGEIACIVYNLLLALDYIHLQEHMHRDLKPGNILINSSGHVKLTDFGIASTKANTNSFIGSPLWMAPEQAAKQSYTQKIDIWALGICILEMAELEAPFQHLHSTRALFAIEHRPQLTFKNPTKFSSELNDFLSKCLVVNSDNRATASELLSHPFITKHKPTFDSIRKQFYESKIGAIKNARMKQVIASTMRNNRASNNLLDQIGEKESKILLEASKDRGKSSIISNEPQTFIERSSFVSDSQEFTNALYPKSQLSYAAKYLRKQNKTSFSGTHNLSRELIAGCGGPLSRESLGSVIKVASFIEQNNTSNNLSIISNLNVSSPSKENLPKYIRDNPFYLMNHKKVSPIPTVEGDENLMTHQNRSHSSIKSEKVIDLRNRLKLDLGKLSKMAMNPATNSVQTSAHKKNYKNFQVSNFVVGKGKQPRSKPPSLNTSTDSDVPPISCEKSSRQQSRKASPRPMTPHKISARQLTSRKPTEVLEDENEESDNDMSNCNDQEVQFIEQGAEVKDLDLSTHRIPPVFRAFESTEKVHFSLRNLNVSMNGCSANSTGRIAQSNLTPNWGLNGNSKFVLPQQDPEKQDYATTRIPSSYFSRVTNDSKNTACTSTDRRARLLEDEENKFSSPSSSDKLMQITLNRDASNSTMRVVDENTPSYLKFVNSKSQLSPIIHQFN